MKILVVNDDGWDAPGIATLRAIAGRRGQVCCVAPLDRRSGCGHQVTFDRPVRFREQEPQVWSVDGWPADCVRLAVARFGKFDWVLSGINEGANLGVDVWLSGTVAAAREAALLGLPAIAFSQYRDSRNPQPSWDDSGRLAETLLDHLLQSPPPAGSLWNVNLPDPHPAVGAPVQFLECPLDLAPLPMDYRHEGEFSAWAGRYRDRAQSPGSDVAVCFSGMISVTLLR